MKNLKNQIWFIVWMLSIIVPFACINIVDARSTRTKSSDVYVNWYYRKDGTYVNWYYRSAPDWIKRNNYSCIDYGQDCWYNSNSIVYTDLKPYYMCDYANGYKKASWDCWCNRWYILSSNKQSCYIDDSYILKMNKSCTKKYPGTVYKIYLDSCICDNWKDYNSEYKTCDPNIVLQKEQQKRQENIKNKNNSCSARFPWTIYNEASDSCSCSGDTKWSSWDNDSRCDRDKIGLKNANYSCIKSFWKYSFAYPSKTVAWKYDCLCKSWTTFSSKRKCEYPSAEEWTIQCKKTFWEFMYSDWTLWNSWWYNCFCISWYVWDNSSKSCILK